MAQLNQRITKEPELERETRSRRSLIIYFAVLFLCAFLLWAFHYLRIPLSRFIWMFGPLAHKFSQLFNPPDLQYIQNMGMLKSIIETFHMGFLGTVAGLALSVPLAWFAALNMTPNKLILYPLGRGIIIGTRAIYEMIWAMLFTMILGFGPLAGAITCLLATIGFCGKLMAEEIEDIHLGPVEAIRATGAGEIKVFVWGILPQVQTAWTGISIYGWDSTFRMATILGYVGAGGIGMYLRETIDTLAYDKTGMTLIIIIALVTVSEMTSAYARQKVS